MTAKLASTAFRNQLLRFINKHVPSRAQAEDILHDVFLKVLTSKGPRDREKLVSWIYRIASHQLADFYREQQKRKEAPLNDDKSVELTPDTTNEMVRCVRPFIEELPAKLRESLVAVEIQGMSQKAYAKAVGANYSTIKSRIQKGRSQLRGKLLQCCLSGSGSCANSCSPR